MQPEMEIISREIIKPTFPTPDHKKAPKLSFLDQIAPPIFIPLIFFYQPPHQTTNKTPTQVSQLLKQSLSNVLSRFYPLAGRIDENNSSVDCNDAGAEYVEARVHARLSRVVEDPNMEELSQFLCIKPYARGSDTLLAVQTNFFDCGGVAIGVCMSHRIGDGCSLVTFVNAWASACHGDAEILEPKFDLANHFPPRDVLGGGFKPTIGIVKEKLVTRRFVFDKEKLKKLKHAAKMEYGVEDPTRIEALSVFIWKKFIEMHEVKTEGNNSKIFAAIHAVNLRPRTRPPLPDHTFGNLWRCALAVSGTRSPESETGQRNLLVELRGSIRKINNDYVENLRDGNEYEEFLKKTSEMFNGGEVEFSNFSSWCRFPVYDVDFGWGKPMWVCTTTMPFKNLVILMGTKCGEGIEAWVNLLEKDMAIMVDYILSI